MTGQKLKPDEDEKLVAARLVAIVESSDDAIISKDTEGIITSWNAGAERIFGYSADEIIGKSVTVLMPPERVNEEPGILRRIRAGETVDHYETVRRRKDGKLIDISLNVSPIRDSKGTIVGASKIARDITEHNRLAAAERDSEMMHRLIDAQESERNRLARDLHDHIGQQLTGIRLLIERITSELGTTHPALEDVQKLRSLTTKMDNDVGFLSWELRPIELDEFGLVNALRNFVREWSQQYEIEAEFDAVKPDSDRRFTREMETSLYRITQEGLNNILKHAGAKKVNVMFHESNNGVSLIIEDDGKGFYPSIVVNQPGGHCLGLVGMKERTEMLKGFFNIESFPGSGTTIFCRIPVSPL